MLLCAPVACSSYCCVVFHRMSILPLVYPFSFYLAYLQLAVTIMNTALMNILTYVFLWMYALIFPGYAKEWNY